MLHVQYRPLHTWIASSILEWRCFIFLILGVFGNSKILFNVLYTFFPQYILQIDNILMCFIILIGYHHRYKKVL